MRLCSHMFKYYLTDTSQGQVVINLFAEKPWNRGKWRNTRHPWLLKGIAGDFTSWSLKIPYFLSDHVAIFFSFSPPKIAWELENEL